MDAIIVQQCIACSGEEMSTLPGESAIKSYSGDFPSPLQAMNYTWGRNDIARFWFPDQEIRGWVKDAARYHGIPNSMLSVILQQEKSPNASTWRQFLQFGERQLTTAAAVLDEWLFDIVPDVVSKGSSGFANMSYNTLKQAALYSKDNYGRQPIPEDIRYRLLGWDSDTRIPGDDWKADLYYAAAHLRELIDRVTNKTCQSGPLSDDEIKAVFRAYNGSGPLAEKYAEDAMARLSAAKNGTGPLYFFER